MEFVLLEKPIGVDWKEYSGYLTGLLNEISTGLSVECRILGVRGEGWIGLGAAGQDLEVFMELLRRRFGIAPVHLQNVEKGDLSRGIVKDASKAVRSLPIDIGILEPTPAFAGLSLGAARAQLADGKPISLGDLVKLYCLHDGVPLEVRITDIDRDRGQIEVWLSDRQEEYFREWVRLPFQRVVAVGALRSRLEASIRDAGLTRDIIRVQELTLTAHELTCKLGTEAPGVIAKLGRLLGPVKLHAFIPEDVRRALKDHRGRATVKFKG